MNTQTVSPETGKRLAAAGFPQPSPAPGQWWADEKTLVYVWNEHEEEEVETVYFTVTKYENRYPYGDLYFDAADFARVTNELNEASGLVYLPTVGDILRELHNHFAAMQGHSVNIEFSPTRDGFSLNIFEDLPFDAMRPIYGTHEHPAEAAALGWFELNSK